MYRAMVSVHPSTGPRARRARGRQSIDGRRSYLSDVKLQSQVVEYPFWTPRTFGETTADW